MYFAVCFNLNTHEYSIFVSLNQGKEKGLEMGKSKKKR